MIRLLAPISIYNDMNYIITYIASFTKYTYVRYMNTISVIVFVIIPVICIMLVDDKRRDGAIINLQGVVCFKV